MSVMDFIALVFAVRAVIDVWLSGSIFATPRAYLQAIQDGPIAASDLEEFSSQSAADTASPLSCRLRDWLIELLLCAFCLSHHAAFWLTLLLLAAPTPLVLLLVRILVYSLAVTQVSYLIDQLLPEPLRYGRPPISNYQD